MWWFVLFCNFFLLLFLFSLSFLFFRTHGLSTRAHLCSGILHFVCSWIGHYSARAARGLRSLLYRLHRLPYAPQHKHRKQHSVSNLERRPRPTRYSRLHWDRYSHRHRIRTRGPLVAFASALRLGWFGTRGATGERLMWFGGPITKTPSGGRRRLVQTRPALSAGQSRTELALDALGRIEWRSVFIFSKTIHYCRLAPFALFAIPRFPLSRFTLPLFSRGSRENKMPVVTLTSQWKHRIGLLTRFRYSNEITRVVSRRMPSECRKISLSPFASYF